MTDVPSQREQSSGQGFLWGALAGLAGAAGMAFLSAVVVGVMGLVSDGAGTALGVFVIYLMFGLFFAAFIGPIGGGLLGLVLSATKKISSAPIVGALTPPAVIVPAAVLWAAIDEGSDVLEAFGLAAGLAVAYAPVGFLAGKLYLRRMMR